jgi:hypothetical protein
MDAAHAAAIFIRPLVFCAHLFPRISRPAPGNPLLGIGSGTYFPIQSPLLSPSRGALVFGRHGANPVSSLYCLTAEEWMTLEEVEKIAEVIEVCQEVDMDRDAAILMVELFSTAFPEFEWNIDGQNGQVKIQPKG